MGESGGRVEASVVAALGAGCTRSDLEIMNGEMSVNYCSIFNVIPTLKSNG